MKKQYLVKIIFEMEEWAESPADAYQMALENLPTVTVSDATVTEKE